MSGWRGIRFGVSIFLTAVLGLHGCGGGGGGSSGNVAATPPGTPGVLPPVLPPPVVLPGCTAPLASAQIPPIPLSVSATSGVAPLAVFFDATATTATTTARPFHELEFRWFFDETVAPGINAWTYGRPGVSRNQAMGPLAAHVFETPGTYNVCVTVTDGTNFRNGQVTITVTNPNTDFATSSICVSTSGSFAACPHFATCTPTTCVTSNDFDDAINSATLGNRGNGTIKRILFRRTETFIADAPARLEGNGPGQIGAYDVGASPTVTSGGGVIPILVGVATNLGFTDWRITDLDFDGVDRSSNAIFPNGPASKITLLRNTIRRHSIGIQMLPLFLNVHNVAFPPAAPIWNQWAIVDNDMFDTTQNGFLGGLTASAFLGNRVRPQNTEHAIRVTFGQKVVISNNDLEGSPSGVPPAAGASALQIRGVHIDPASPLRNTGENQFTIPANTFTEQIVVSDNTLLGGNPATNGAAFAFGIRAVNLDQTVWFRDIIVERNRMVAHANTGSGSFMEIQATLTTVRNNLFDLSAIPMGGTTPAGGLPVSSFRSMEFRRNGCNPGCVGLTTDNAAVFNNSSYSGSADGGSSPFVVVDINGNNPIPPANPMVVRNNIGYAPANVHGQTGIVRNNSGGTVVRSNNSDVDPVPGTTIQTNPLFTATPPVLGPNWQPQAGSYAIGGGAAQGQPSVTPGQVPVFSDYFGACVPDCTSARTGNHMGAVIP